MLLCNESLVSSKHRSNFWSQMLYAEIPAIAEHCHTISPVIDVHHVISAEQDHTDLPLRPVDQICDMRLKRIRRDGDLQVKVRCYLSHKILCASSCPGC